MSPTTWEGTSCEMTDKPVFSNGNASMAAVTVLSVSSSEEDRACLRNILSHSSWKLYEAACCHEALEVLRSNHTPVVISASELPDGDWKALLEQMETLDHQPVLIVSSCLADERLWAEVLNLGGYDVLLVPYEAQEVFRVAFLAWHSAKRRRENGIVSRRPPQQAESVEKSAASSMCRKASA